MSSSSSSPSERSRQARRAIVERFLPHLPKRILQQHRKRARRSLRSFCTYVDPGYQPAPHLLRLIAALEAVERGEILRLIVTMPPRHGKSETVSRRFPAWFLGRNPRESVIIGSYGADLAYDFSRAARNTLAEHGRDVFEVSLADDSAAVSKWSLAGHPGGLIAAGVGGPVTGRGAKVLIVDDPHKNAEEASSKLRRDRAFTWVNVDLRTRLAPGGAMVLVQTRWHKDDVAGRFLEIASKGGEQWVVIDMPALDATGNALWPERYSAAYLQQLRETLGAFQFGALYQQQPTDPDGTIFKREHIGYYDEEPRDVAADCDTVILSADCAFKDEEDSDFVALQVWGSRRAGATRPTFFLLDQVRDRMGFTETLNAIRALAAKWPGAIGKLVEDKANGTAVIETLQRELAGVVAIEPRGGKLVRARAVSPLFEAGNVRISRRAPWTMDFVEELAGFPRAANDDQVDAMSQALAHLAAGDDPADQFRRLSAL